MTTDDNTPPSHPASPPTRGDNVRFQVSASSKTVRRVIASVALTALSGLTGYGGHQWGASRAAQRIDELEAKLDAHVQAQNTADHQRDEKLEKLETEIAGHLGGIDRGIGDLNGAINTLATRLDNHLAHPEKPARHRVTSADSDDP